MKGFTELLRPSIEYFARFIDVFADVLRGLPITVKAGLGFLALAFIVFEFSRILIAIAAGA